MKLFRTLTLVVSSAVAGCAGTHANPGTALPSNSFAPLPPAVRGALTRRPKQNEDPFRHAFYLARAPFDDVEIYSNEDYHFMGRITDGIAEPVAVSMDLNDNLYVANYRGGNVTEYAPGATTPSFVYNADMSHPVAVTVDRLGDVYEADGNGYVIQYLHRDNHAYNRCGPRREAVPTAVAVDGSGHVFVSYYSYEGRGGLFEYLDGLYDCPYKAFLPAIGTDATSNLVMDANRNLIAIGQPAVPAINVIAPPYSSITRKIGGAWVYGASLNRDNKLLFVAYGPTVTIFDYRTGEEIRRLDGEYGIYGGTAIVDAPNAVY